MRLLWLLSAIPMLILVAPFAEAVERKPNVLFLICDDLNCDLACYGHPLVSTPNIDRLAERGVRFERAYCQYPLCGPSRASFMTGLYPDQTLVRQNAVYIREHVPNVLTIPQTFRSAGYFAQRIGKIFHYNVPRHIGTSGHDDPYSWNYTINPRGRDKDDESQIFTLKKSQFGGTLSWHASDGDDSEQTDGIAAAEAVKALKKFSESGKPFFLAVGLYRPHTPYVAPKHYFDMYDVDEIAVPELPPDYYAALPDAAVRSITDRPEQLNLEESIAKQAIQAYYASITFADAQIGQILDALVETELAANTIVVFTSDHGYHMGEHGHYQKTTLFENAARVPLIMAGPGISAGRSTMAIAEMTDIYPTINALAGVPVPEFVAGVSQLPVLQNSAASVRDSALTQLRNGTSIRTARYRYTEWGDEGVDGVELYDHENDPQEMENLATETQHLELRQSLSAKLRERKTQAAVEPPGIVQIRTKITRRVPQPND